MSASEQDDFEHFKTAVLESPPPSQTRERLSEEVSRHERRLAEIRGEMHALKEKIEHTLDTYIEGAANTTVLGQRAKEHFLEEDGAVRGAYRAYDTLVRNRWMDQMHDALEHLKVHYDDYSRLDEERMYEESGLERASTRRSVQERFAMTQSLRQILDALNRYRETVDSKLNMAKKNERHFRSVNISIDRRSYGRVETLDGYESMRESVERYESALSNIEHAQEKVENALGETSSESVEDAKTEARRRFSEAIFEENEADKLWHSAVIAREQHKSLVYDVAGAYHEFGAYMQSDDVVQKLNSNPTLAKAHEKTAESIKKRYGELLDIAKETKQNAGQIRDRRELVEHRLEDLKESEDKLKRQISRMR